MAGINYQKPGYPFVEVVKLVCPIAAPLTQTVLNIPANTIIDSIVMKQTVQGVRAAGALTISLGDEDAATGFILAQDAKAAVATNYGIAVAEKGAYFAEAVGGDQTPMPGKWYASEKNVIATMSATSAGASDVAAQFAVIVRGVRFSTP